MTEDVNCHRIDRKIVEKCRQVTEEKDKDHLLSLIDELTRLFDQRDRLLKEGQNARTKSKRGKKKEQEIL